MAGLVALTLASSLSACGGGSSEVLPQPVITSRISGVVAKGRVSGATVCAYRIDAGAVSSQLGQCVLSDQQGNYQLSFEGTAEQLVVEARGGTYLDEATGNTLPLGTLRNLPTTEPYAGVLWVAHVTPITELSARRAIAGGALTSDRIKAAADEVLQSFKIGASSNEPSDLTTRSTSNDFLSQRYGLYLAGISAMAEGSNLSATLDAIGRDITNKTMASRNVAFNEGVSRFLNSPRNQSGITASQLPGFVGSKPFGDPL
jgi:hypothetical protein